MDTQTYLWIVTAVAISSEILPPIAKRCFPAKFQSVSGLFDLLFTILRAIFIRTPNTAIQPQELELKEIVIDTVDDLISERCKPPS